MVPFSFENITRSAALDTWKALPVSDAARATHESFESHLQRATAFTPNQSPRGTNHDDKPRERPASASTDAPRNPTTDQSTQETRRDGDSIHEDDTAEAAPTSKPEVDHDQEHAEQDSGTGDEVVVAGTIEVQRAIAQELELQASGDSEDNADDEAAGKLAEAALREEHSELDTALATNVEASAEQR
ncbi:MAG: hypothetical protein HYV60_03875, partial [Planctomycetia bacterium]|nr:hypothetical protein [Planctomycetia bacterium]